MWMRRWSARLQAMLRVLCRIKPFTSVFDGIDEQHQCYCAEIVGLQLSCSAGRIDVDSYFYAGREIRVFRVRTSTVLFRNISELSSFNFIQWLLLTTVTTCKYTALKSSHDTVTSLHFPHFLSHFFSNNLFHLKISFETLLKNVIFATNCGPCFFSF